MDEKPTIFLSYAHADYDKVRSLYKRLSAAGFKPWLDKEAILPGQDWKLCIEKAVKHCDFFMPCLSNNSSDRRGVIQREIRAALDSWQEKLQDDIYLIPVRLEDCHVPEGLSKFQWVDLFGENKEAGWKKLIKAIKTGAGRLGLEIEPTDPAAKTRTEPKEPPKRASSGSTPSSPAGPQNATKAKLSLQAGKTTVVLIGASEFSKDPKNLAPLPAVKNNVIDLEKALCDDSIVGLEHTDVHTILDEAKASDVLTQLAELSNKAQGTLIVYYAGHGLVSKRSNLLYLATSETTDKLAEYNAMPFDKIRSAIDDSEASKKILIVDSCFSGKIEGGMSPASSLLRTNLEFDEVFSIASASKRQPALAPTHEKHTVFTGELIEALNEGLDNKKEVINLKELFEHIRRNLKRRGAPEPESFNMQNANTIVLARNRKYVPGMEIASSGDDCAEGSGDSHEIPQVGGIVEILYRCHDLLHKAVKAGGNIWFVGMTYAFGPAHNIRKVQEDWTRKHPDEVIFTSVVDEFNEHLCALLRGTRRYSSQVCMVTLKKDLLLSKFITPLYRKPDYAAHLKRYPGHLTTVEREIMECQEDVEESAAKRGYTVAYVDDILWQVIVTDIERDGRIKKACVKLNIGTHNVRSTEATGFYSEDPDVCRKWIHETEQLYKRACS